jgi:F-type H+-transporting ATPase subunit delta
VSQASQSSNGAADRYAAALFDLARDDKAVDSVEADLKTLKAAIAGAPDLAEVLASPLIPADQKSPALQAVAQKLGLSALTVKFVGLVASNGRANLLPQMINAGLRLASQARGEVVARVVTAAPLDAKTQTKLQKSLADTLKTAVALETEVRPDLLGGLVVEVGSRQFDASIRTKLDTLKIALKGT